MIFTPTLLLAPGGTGTSLAFSHHPCFLMPTTDNLFSLSAVRHSARKRLILALKGLDRLVGVEFLQMYRPLWDVLRHRKKMPLPPCRSPRF